MYSTSTNYKNKILADSTRQLLNVYIDNNKIEERYILECSISYTLLSNDEFCFGSTPAKIVNLKIHKNALPETYNRFYIESGILGETIPIGYFNVDKISKDDDYTVSLTLIDDMSKFEFNYDGSTLSYPVSLLTVLQDICSKAGVDLSSTSFLNSDKQVAVYDNTITARTYLSYIAEQAGGFAVIGRDGKLYIKTIGEDTTELALRYFSEFSWGERFKISRIAYEDGVQDFKKGNEVNNTVWISSENMYIVEQEQIDNIYNQYQNFEVNSFSGTSIIDPAWDIGDILIIGNRKVLFQGELEYKGKFKANISSNIQAKSKEETTATKISNDTKIRRVQSQISQIEGTIIQLVQEQSEQSNQMTQIIQDVNGITQQVQNTIQVLSKVTGTNYLKLDNCAETTLKYFKINGPQQVYTLYPSTTLYPSPTLYPAGKSRTMRIIVDTQPRGQATQNKKVYKFKISPYLGENDAIIIENGKLLIDRNGTITEQEDMEIELFEGTNYIYVLDETDLTIYAEYLIANELNKYYGTKVEIASQIKQEADRIALDVKEIYASKAELTAGLELTATEINLSVNQKLTDYSTTEEMNAAIEITSNGIMQQVNQKVGEDELGTKIQQNYESVQIAWNKISDYIQFINAELQILNNNKIKLMTLDKLGQHFYDSSGNEIGDVGLISNETGNAIAFSIYATNTNSNKMQWGLKSAENEFIPIFEFRDYNTNVGTEVGGMFYFESPAVLNEKELLLSNDTEGPYILGFNYGTSNSCTIGNTDNFYVSTKNNELIINANMNYLKLSDFLEVSINNQGTYSFDFKNNSIINVENVPFSTEVDYFSSTTGDYLYVGLKSGGGFILYPEYSDMKLKKDITDSKENAIEKIMKIQHRSYKWKNNNKQINIGYIAQELEKIDENFVRKTSYKTKDGNEDVEYQINIVNLLSTITKAIQEQEEEIKKLKKI